MYSQQAIRSDGRVRGGGAWAVVAALAAAVLFAGSSFAQTLKVVVSVPPLHGLVKEIAPAGSEVEMLIRPGRSEHGYEISSKDAERLARADVVVWVGLNLEPRLEKALERVPKDKQSRVRFADVVGLKADDHADHDHEHGTGCDHAVDPHLWLDPDMVLQLLPAVRDAMREAMRRKGLLDDGASKALSERLRKTEERVRAVRDEWRKGLAPYRGAAIVTHHDAFGRPAARFGLKIAAVVRPGASAEPSPKDIEKAVESIRTQRVRAVFVEPQYDAKIARKIAAQAGVPVGELDPLGDGDWVAMMEKNLAALRSTLGGAPGHK
ncbi:MAG TPA: metal ABC transporter substrate-binding protein [Phycisphaerales bacterium]|nr:metal ABC transporter substrate-binding protein [Phycisphaerales bacterium]